jgi:hypothetical protein
MKMQSSDFIKEKLHHYIDSAADAKLQAIYVLLENEIKTQYTTSDIDEFNLRRENHLSGESKSYTMEESFNLIRNQNK